MAEDKRIRNRVDFEEWILCYKHINVSSNVRPDPSPIRIQIRDISYSGIGIRCNRDLGIGDCLIFNLKNGTMSKEFMMEVHWCRYNNGLYLAGLSFLGLTKDRVIFLDGLIKSFIKKQVR